MPELLFLLKATVAVFGILFLIIAVMYFAWVQQIKHDRPEEPYYNYPDQEDNENE